MIDTHCHLTAGQLRPQLGAVIERAIEAGVDRMITIGTTAGDSAAARKIAHHHDPVFFTSGIQPHDAHQVDHDDIAQVIDLGRDAKCAAFGEMGLEYYYDDPPRRVQWECFAAQLQAIADNRINKPIVIHCREAVDDTLAVMRESGLPAERFVFHCHTEPPPEARKVLDAGAMISFTGIVTYKSAEAVRQSAMLVPDDRLMVETDAPYLTPEPHRKIKPNEPRFVTDTARFLADLRNMPFEQFSQLVDANAQRFFAFGDQA